MPNKPRHRDDAPDIILFMTDQQRGDCLSIDGHPVLMTPVMDNMGWEGSRFTRAYSSCPTCTPARRCLLAGRTPFHNDMVGMKTSPWEPQTTLPRALRAAGYQTAIVGRNMHQYRPDTHYGFEAAVQDHPYQSGKSPADWTEWFAHGIAANGWTARPWFQPEHLHYTHWVVDRAIEFLREHRDPSRPLFLVVSFVAPHPPLVPPAFYMERYLRLELPEPVIGDWAEPPPNDGLGVHVESRHVHLRGEALRSCLAGYFGLINHVDDQIFRVLNMLGRLGRMGNTVTMLTSDHGEMLGDHYRFRKALPYEGSARIPLLIKVPEALGAKPGVVCDAPVGLEDIMPTVLDLAGVPIPECVDGRSLLPFMRGEPDPDWRPWLHGEHARHPHEWSHHYVTNGKEKYIWYSQCGTEQLFDLVNDPHELRNLAAVPDAADRLATWRQRMVQTLRDRPEGFVSGENLVAGRPHEIVPPRAAVTRPN